MAAFSEDEAKQLTAFYQSDLGRKVLSKEAFVQSEVLKTFQTSPETIRSLFVAGCVGGGIGGQVESVEKAMATVDAKLPSKEVMYQNLEPFARQILPFCTCLMDKFVAEWGIDNVLGRMITPEGKTVAQRIVREGGCVAPKL